MALPQQKRHIMAWLHAETPRNGVATAETPYNGVAARRNATQWRYYSHKRQEMSFVPASCLCLLREHRVFVRKPLLRLARGGQSLTALPQKTNGAEHLV
jgi:hypothetical protein